MNPDWITLLTTVFSAGLTIGHIKSRLATLSTDLHEFKTHAITRFDKIEARLEAFKAPSNGLDSGSRGGH